MLSSSVPPLLCRVFRFLGGSFGSDSPRLRVTGALERELGRVERGAMVVKMRKRWEEREGEYEVSDGRRHVAMWAEGYNHFHIWKLTSALYCIVLISQKNKRFVSLVVISALLVHLLGCWFNSHLLHFNFLNYVITKNLLDSGRLSPLDSSRLSPGRVRRSPCSLVDSAGLRRTLKLKFGLCHTNTFRNLSPADSARLQRTPPESVGECKVLNVTIVF